MTMSNSDARKRKAASDVDLPATPGYIERLVRERDAARADADAAQQAFREMVVREKESDQQYTRLHAAVAALADQHDGLKVADELRGLLEDGA